METIRVRACNGLMSLPRIGMGVGGLLLGVKSNGLITVTGSIEIPCSHTNGPSFNLTDAEKQRASELIGGAGDRGVVGWYCSKTRGPAVLGDSELALYKELFPRQDQIVLLLRPSTVQPTRAAFFYRDAKGAIIKAIECDVDELQTPEATLEEPPSVPREEPQPIKAAEAIAAPAPAQMEAEPEAISVATPTAMPMAMPESAPRIPVSVRNMFAFATEPPPRKQSKSRSWVLGVAALVALGAAAFLTENSWIPRPPLALSSTESEGNLLIRWNVDALRGVNQASLLVNDGGNLKALPLDRFQLKQGLLVYSPKSQRVTAKLSAGDASAIAVWLAPPAPEPPPAQPTADAQPATPKPARRKK
jgi:hypothetical protein